MGEPLINVIKMSYLEDSLADDHSGVKAGTSVIIEQDECPQSYGNSHADKNAFVTLT